MKDLPKGYRISGARADMRLNEIHEYLTASYWAKGISQREVQKIIAKSDCVGLFHGDQQIGFARVVSDSVRIAYLCDVYVLAEHRGRGLAVHMVEFLQDKSELRSVVKWLLTTADAHGLYDKLGWKPLDKPRNMMERRP